MDSVSFDYASEYFQGQGFMGYSILSMMAVRSEYRAAVEVIANESTRKWIELKSTATDKDLSDKIAKLYEEMERLNLRDVFRTAVEHDGFFGRGQIYINIDDCQPEKRNLPLVISDKTIKKGSLKGFKNIEPIWTTPQNYDTTDPTAEDFYKPRAWWVLGTATHSDRLLTIVSREVPDMLKAAYNFGGLSLIQIMQPYVERWWRTVEAVANLVNNYSTSGIKTDMGSILQSGYASDETAASAAGTLLNRIKMFVETRDNRGMMILDKGEEEFFQFNVPLSGLDALLGKAQEQMCMPCHIPLVKYTGITPSGLNASSEGEIKVFYDWIHSEQENNLRQPLTKILQVMQLSLFGELDNSITFDFCPLEEMTELELATIRETNQRIDTGYIDAGVLAPEEPRARLRTDKNSGYQNLTDDAPELPDAEPDAEENAAMDLALDKSEHWVTINGARVLIDSEGEVIGGAGGKLKGKSFPDAVRSADVTGIHKHDDLLTAIAKNGGLSRKEAVSQGIDPAMLNYKTVGGHRLFNNGKNAKNYDEAQELISQHGYEVDGENDLVQKVSDSVNNNIAYYTPEGHENNADKEYSNGYDWQHEQRKESVINAAKTHDATHATNYLNAVQELESKGMLYGDELAAWEDDFGLNDKKTAMDTDKLTRLKITLY
jgi:phage-related protein (TIGR01555 family)